MSNTPILDIVEVAENQTDRYLTINAALNALEGASHAIETDTSTGTTTIDYTNATGTPATYLENFLFDLTGTKTGAFDMTVPSVTPTGAVAITRLFAVRNDTSQTVTIETETAGTSVTLADGEEGFFYQSANVITQINAPAVPDVVVIPYDMSMYAVETPAADDILAEIIVARAITIPASFSGSYGRVGVIPTTAAFVVDINKNGSALGTASFALTTGTVTFSGISETSFAAGDRISFVAPTTPDAVCAEIAITLAATVD